MTQRSDSRRAVHVEDKTPNLRPKRRNQGRPEVMSSLETRLRERYAVLPESERKVADLLRDFPGEIDAYSATELAALAGASKAAVTRLIRRLDYASFKEARRAARDARRWGSPVYLLKSGVARNSFAARIQKHVEQDIANITRTLSGLTEKVFQEIVKGMAEADRVWLLGYRNSRYLAGYARWQLIQVRGGVHIVPGAGETLAESLADLRSNDFLLVIGFRRRVPEIARALETARKAQVPTLYVTDPTARDSSLATWTIRCEVRGEDLFDRYASAISLLHFLSVAVVSHLAASGRAHLKRIEALHEILNDFA